MKQKKSNKDYTKVLKERGADIYDFMGELLKKSDNDDFVIEKLKTMNETAKQSYNNGSLVMRACKYDYDVKKLELEARRLALDEKKFEREQAAETSEL